MLLKGPLLRVWSAGKFGMLLHMTAAHGLLQCLLMSLVAGLPLAILNKTNRELAQQLSDHERQLVLQQRRLATLRATEQECSQHVLQVREEVKHLESLVAARQQESEGENAMCKVRAATGGDEAWEWSGG